MEIWKKMRVGFFLNTVYVGELTLTQQKDWPSHNFISNEIYKRPLLTGSDLTNPTVELRLTIPCYFFKANHDNLKNSTKSLRKT